MTYLLPPFSPVLFFGSTPRAAQGSISQSKPLANRNLEFAGEIHIGQLGHLGHVGRVF